MLGTCLLVFFESSDHSGTIVDRQERGLVGEIMDHPVRNNADQSSYQAFEDEDPSLSKY